MNSRFIAAAIFVTGALAFAQPPNPNAPPPPMSFFVTSTGPGKGGDLGGLAGADAYCQKLATAAGAGDRTWHAYLSTQAADGKPAVNARDRIGTGPWYSPMGLKIADNVAALHGDTLELARLGPVITKTTAVDENKQPHKGVGDNPNQHDVLTGSTLEGKAYTDGMDHTCRNWTYSGTEGSGQVGHLDRTGGTNGSWVSAHGSRGCTQENLVSTGGAGFLYCFAINPARQ
jgi:hypothetical protein